MNALRIALAAMIVGALAIGCKKEAKRDTPEKLVAEYKANHAKGPDAVMTLVYKSDQIPEKMLDVTKMSVCEKDLKIKSITTEPFNDPDYEKGVEAMKKMKVKMPAKPTHRMKITYEPKGKMTAASASIPIAKIDGMFYLIAPIKAQ